MKKGLFLIGTAGILGMALFIAIFITTLAPAPDREALTAADHLLAAGHTAEAIDVYEQLIAQGLASSALFYNLGIAYQQQENTPAAYQAYRQAAELAPRDADIRHNLALVQAELGEEAPAGMLPHWLAVNELALLALGSWFLFMFLFLWLRTVKPGRGKRLLQTAILLAFLWTLTSGAILTTRMVQASLPAAPLSGMVDQA